MVDAAAAAPQVKLLSSGLFGANGAVSLSPQSAFMQGRFNTIQKSMLEWNEMHPYSAIHVVQVRGALDEQRLRYYINSTIEKRGLTHLRLDPERFLFEYQGGPADCAIRTITGREEPFFELVAEMERQLNLAFNIEDSFSPFRFLILPGADFFFLGLVYFHPVADAEAVLYLLKEIVTAYVEGVTSDSGASLEIYPDSRAHLLREHPLVVCRKLMAFPALMRKMRRSHRPPIKMPGTWRQKRTDGLFPRCFHGSAHTEVDL
jgi:hypothetical protein